MAAWEGFPIGARVYNLMDPRRRHVDELPINVYIVESECDANGNQRAVIYSRTGKAKAVATVCAAREDKWKMLSRPNRRMVAVEYDAIRVLNEEKEELRNRLGFALHNLQIANERIAELTAAFGRT